MQKLFIATVAAAVVAPLTAVQSQVPVPSSDSRPSLPSFEVVSVRVNRSGEPGHRMQARPDGRIMVTNAPLRTLIETAYGVLPQQVLGGSGLLDSERFDIAAQTGQNLPPSPPGVPPGPAQLMLQRLLAERFKLTIHTAKRELPIYALTLAKEDDSRLGPRISGAKVDCAALMAAYARGAAALPPRSDCSITGASGRVSARGASMAMFARAILVGVVDRIVEDRTGLSGGFDFDLEFAVDPGTAPATGVGSNGASIFAAPRGTTRAEAARRACTSRRAGDR